MESETASRDVFVANCHGIVSKFTLKLGEFGLGDLVDSFHAESGRRHMPGTGMIICIRPDEERPFICEHDNLIYSYKESEIVHTDVY